MARILIQTDLEMSGRDGGKEMKSRRYMDEINSTTIVRTVFLKHIELENDQMNHDENRLRWQKDFIG